MRNIECIIRSGNAESRCLGMYTDEALVQLRERLIQWVEDGAIASWEVRPLDSFIDWINRPAEPGEEK